MPNYQEREVVRVEKREAAEKDYMLGMKYKDIAEKYDVSLNTVKSWKQRYGWQKSKKRVHTKNQKGCTQNNDKNNAKQQALEEEEIELTENSALNSRQLLFCQFYIQCFNATKAYQKAYECSYGIAASAGSRLLRNVKVQEEIKKLNQNKINRAMLSEDDIFQKYMDIAFADITDFVEFDSNGIRFKESALVDGTLISEVKEGKAGRSIKLADRMQALRWLNEHMVTEDKAKRGQIEAILKAVKEECE